MSRVPTMVKQQVPGTGPRCHPLQQLCKRLKMPDTKAKQGTDPTAFSPRDITMR